jgi:hypothetical protein
VRIAIATNRHVDFAKGLAEAVERFRRADEILVPFVALGELRAGFAGGARTGDNEANLVPFLDSRRVDVVFADEDTDSRLDLTYSANSDGWPGDRDPPRELPDGHGQGMSRWHRLPHIAPLLAEA